MTTILLIAILVVLVINFCGLAAIYFLINDRVFTLLTIMTGDIQQAKRASAARQSRVLLRESSPGEPPTPKMARSRREVHEEAVDPEKPHTPLADPEHPDRPFFG